MKAKKLIAIMMAAALVGGLAGCGLNRDADSTVEGGLSAIGESSAPEEETAEEEAAGPIPEAVIRSQEMRSEKDEILYCFGSYDTIRLTKDSKKDCPELAEGLESYNKQIEKTAKDQFQDIADMAKEDYANIDKEYFEGYSVTYKNQIVRADDRFLSFLENYEGYAGGAHGMYTTTGHSFDVKTGKELALTDVVVDEDSLRAVLVEELSKKYRDELQVDPEEAMLDYGTDRKVQFDWVLEQHALHIFFQPYDLAPYAAGILDVSLSFENNPDLFTDDFEVGEGAYTAGLDLDQSYLTDCNGDGKLDAVKVTADWNEDADITGMTVAAGGEKVKEELHVYGLHPVYMQTANGDGYLYIVSDEDNDWHTLYVYDLNGEAPKKIAEEGLGFYRHYDSEETTDFYPILNPAHFSLSSRGDLLSTYDVHRDYHMGDDGKPVPDTEYYLADATNKLKMKANVPASKVDANGKVTEKEAMIPAGTECKIARTDLKSYVDLKDGDDYYRVKVTFKEDEGGQFVGDQAIEDLFDGMHFAG